MINTYLNARALLIPVVPDIQTGAIEYGVGEMIRCQVVDATEIVGNNAGRDLAESSNSLVVMQTSVTIKEGDKLQVTSIRGVSVIRPERVVKSVMVKGGFRASHKEVLI